MGSQRVDKGVTDLPSIQSAVVGESATSGCSRDRPAHLHHAFWLPGVMGSIAMLDAWHHGQRSWMHGVTASDPGCMASRPAILDAWRHGQRSWMHGVTASDPGCMASSPAILDAT